MKTIFHTKERNQLTINQLIVRIDDLPLSSMSRKIVNHRQKLLDTKNVIGYIKGGQIKVINTNSVLRCIRKAKKCSRNRLFCLVPTFLFKPIY